MPPRLPPLTDPIDELRHYRNTRLYRSLARTLRAYNRQLVDRLHERGFTDFAPAFPPILSNLDTKGTRIGVLAARAGVTRQAAGQLLRHIESCGYVERRGASSDARATMVHFTAKGRRLLATVLELVDEIEARFEARLGADAYERVRSGLLTIADDIDPGGALGRDDAARATPTGAVRSNPRRTRG